MSSFNWTEDPGHNAKTFLQYLKHSKANGVPENRLLVEVSGSHNVNCSEKLFIPHISKNKLVSWVFTVTSSTRFGPWCQLKHVFMLDPNLPEFSITNVSIVDRPVYTLHTGCQDWQNNIKEPSTEFKVTIQFVSSCYGNFYQRVVFGFGSSPKIVRNLGVMVGPETSLVKQLSYKRPSSEDNELNWLIKYELITYDGQKGPVQSSYKVPESMKPCLEFGAFDHLDDELTTENYRYRLHTLLFIEEYERRRQLTRLNLNCDDLLQCTSKSVEHMDRLSIKLAVNPDILEDTNNLINRSSRAIVKLVPPGDNQPKLYEVVVEALKKDSIVLLGSEALQDTLNQAKSPVPASVCFRFVDTYKYMHQAVDNINLGCVFPRNPGGLSLEWDIEPHPFLNTPQATALSHILDPRPKPPLLIFGPFGTGKTRTIAEAVKELCRLHLGNPAENLRILICTHSNSAADHYIVDYLHPFVMSSELGSGLCTPLRICWENRFLSTVSSTVLNYSFISKDTGKFAVPSKEVLDKYRVVVTTLVTADVLIGLGLPDGYFSHVFIDEAAQAMEAETLIPLCLSTPSTRVVLAGDHLQLGAIVYSPMARHLTLGRSLLVRLYDFYPRSSNCKLLLLENYRAYQDIVDIPSKLFYEGTLIAHKTKPPLSEYPVHFYGVLGKETRAPDIPSYYNMAEAAEISERVEELVEKWTWEFDDEANVENICVLAPYTAQVREIRQLLRKKKLGRVRVESVNNVQGLEFDAIFISTVHTSYAMTAETLDRHDLGFMSDPRLLNTAVTRAKYHLVFVGDPSALCGAGDCKVCWRTILSKCNEFGTFHYRLSFEKVMEYTRITNPNHGITNGAAVSTANNHPSQVHTSATIAASNHAPQAHTSTSIAASGHQPTAQPVVIDAGTTNQGVFMSSNGPIFQPVSATIYQQRPGVVPASPFINARPQLQAVMDPSGTTRGFVTGVVYPTGQVRMYAGQNGTMVQSLQFNANQRLPYTPVYNQGPVFTQPRVQGPVFTQPQGPGQPMTHVQGPGQPMTHVQGPGQPFPQVHFIGPQTGPVPGYSVNPIPSQQSTWQVPNQPPLQTFATPRTESPLTNQFGNPTKLSRPTPSDSPASKASSSPSLDIGTNSLRGTANIPSQSRGETPSSLGRASPAQAQGKIFNMLAHAGKVSPSGHSRVNIVQAIMESIQCRRKMLTEENSWLAALCAERTLRPNEVTENIIKQLQLITVEIDNVSQRLSVHELLARQLDVHCTDATTPLNGYTDQFANQMRRISLDCDEEVQRLLQSPFSVDTGSENTENKEFDDSDTEEWFLARREDPLVQEYIKAFESLAETFSSERAEEQSQFYQVNPDESTCWLLEPTNDSFYIRNSIHQEYEDEDIVFANLLNNDLVLCTLEINSPNSGLARVLASDLKAMHMGSNLNEMVNFDAMFSQDIVISTRVDMNRAFHGDIVAVEVDEKSPSQPRGRVVFIFKEVHPRECICTADAQDSNVMIPVDKNNPNIFVMQSKDHRGEKGVAVFTIRGGETKCREFITNTSGCLFLVRVLEWGVNYRLPLGIVRKCFKEVSDLNSAVPVFAAEYCIRASQPEDAMNEVANSFSDNYQVPETEWLSRAYRYDNAFTLDCGASLGMELDDAISIVKEKGGAYSVGVHVADVSYFVRKDSCVDRAAFTQGSSVYPEQQNGSAINMLPPRLSQNLCSLLPRQDRLAVSVIFRLDKDGQVIKPPDIHRSVVASCCSLTFKECDDILDGKSSKTLPVNLERDIRLLENLTRKIALRQIRLGCVSGALNFIHNSQSRASQIVEQLMLMANGTVAQRLLLSARTKYLTPLRRQLPPKYHLSDSLHDWCADNDVLPKGSLSLQRLPDSELHKDHKREVKIDLSCLGHISTAVNAQDISQLTEALLKCENSTVMADALSRFCSIQDKSQYIVSSFSQGVQLKHFTLGVECYTQFTSPIRRYFDLVVHRCLLALIYDKPLPYNLKELQDICLQCQMTSARANAFEKSCMSTSLANALLTSQQCHVTSVERVHSDRFTLQCKTGDTCKPYNRVIKVQQLGPSTAGFLENDKELVLTWNKRDIQCSTPRAPTPQPPANQPEAQSDKYFVKIQAQNWMLFISEVIRGSIKRINKQWKKVNSNSLAVHPGSSISTRTKQLTTTESANSFTARFVTGARVNVVLGSEQRRGVVQPVIRGVEVSPSMFVCTSHRHNPESAFCLPLSSPALASYVDVQEYQRIMIPLVETESAASVLRSCKASVRLCGVNLSWTGHGHSVRANLMLPKVLYESQDLKVSVGDYLCIRSETPSFIKTADQTNSNVYTLLHARVSQISQHSDRAVLTIEPTESSSSLSAEALERHAQKYTIELIPQSSRYKYILEAVKSLGQATEILRSIVLRQDLLFTPVKLDVSVLRLFPLDIDQAEAVKSAINSPFTVIHGPPGTGKTWTAVAIMCHFINNNWQARGGQVLLCAPTNKALDVIAKMLVKIPSVNVLRVYSREEESSDSSVVIEDCEPVALHLRVRKPENPHANALRMCLLEIDQISQRIEQSELPERENLQKKLMNRKQKLNAILDAAEGHEFTQTSAHVIVCTCAEAGSPRVRKFAQVSQCIVDECNMCLDAELLVPLILASQRCEHMVLIGDPKQLVPVLHSKKATKYGLGRSLFESLAEQHAGKKYECRLLRMQFRMHPSLRVFSSEYFYKDRPVFDTPEVSNSTVHMEGFWPNPQEKYHVFCDVTGEELVFDDQDADRCNPTEIEKIVAVVNHFESFGYKAQHICIISPFVTQRNRIKDALTDQDVQIMSPQESQGSEHSFVIFSTVRSSSAALHPWKIGCLGDGHQMNVALTRARLGMVIIGDKQFLETIPIWKRLLSEYNSVGCVVDGSSWP